MMSRSVFRILSAALLPAAMLCFAVQSASAQQATQVGVDVVSRTDVEQTFPVIGRLVPRRSGTVAARIEGPVERVAVEVGDRVEAGAVLAVIDRARLELERQLAQADLDQARAQIQVAEARLGQAELTLARLDGLRDSAAFSPARFEDAEQSVVTAQREVVEARAVAARREAELGLARLDLERAEVRAPYDGVVTQRHTEAGAYITRGAPIVDMLDENALEIEADVPVDRLVGLAPGTTVSARFEIGAASIPARIRAIVPQENPLTRTRAVRFELDHAAAARERIIAPAAEQSVTVDLPAGLRGQRPTVHKDAITRTPSGFQVFIAMPDGVAMPRNVSIGRAVGNRFEVMDGLETGDIVVIRGNERLRPGQRITYEKPG